jgi:hypothetical protein
MLEWLSIEKASCSMISELATRLDEQYPDWAKQIDIATLNMNDSSHCVIGQCVTSGDRSAYNEGVRSLQREGESISGYFLGTYTNQWVAEIEARRN